MNRPKVYQLELVIVAESVKKKPEFKGVSVPVWPQKSYKCSTNVLGSSFPGVLYLSFDEYHG